MYTTYILFSKTGNRHYIGHTSDLTERLNRHNSGLVRSTKSYIPWKVVYTEEYPTKSAAFRREMEIKSYHSGYKFQELRKQFICLG